MLAVLGMLVTSPAARAVSVLTQHNDTGRSGANLSEVTLTTSNVNVNQFGKLFSRAVDGEIYAQPLYVPGVTVAGKGAHNVVYVATMHNSVYAFDADDPAQSTSLWQINLGPTVPAVDVQCCCTDISTEIGILSTPVIDPVSGTLYLVSRNKNADSTYHQWLHALDITSGAEKFAGPVEITATGFDPKIENQRSALLLQGGVVYIAWASHNDCGPYHGWIMGYNASTLQRTALFNDTPSGVQAGIWQAGQGPTVDANGNIYVMTGNGSYDGVSNFGESFLRLTPALAVADWFTPFNVDTLNSQDADLGSSGALYLPGTTRIVGGGKEGKLYLIDTAAMGHFTSGSDNVVQSFPATLGHIHGSPIYWNSPVNGPTVYVWSEQDHLKAFQYANGLFNTTPVSQSPMAVPNGMPGGMLSISANNSTAGSGIVWASHPVSLDANHASVPGILRAFDASNVSVELWNSQQNSARDNFGNLAKFTAPTIANGKVYLATFSNQLCVYGALTAGPPAAIAIDAGGAAAGSFVADADFTGGTVAANYTGAIDTSAVINPAPQAVYQTERYGNFSYTVPGFTASSSLKVRLHFSEDYWTASGQRIQNVTINGTQVLTNFDIFATAGAAHKANIQEFTTTANASGQAVIAFAPTTGSPDQNGKVDGIEVIPLTASIPSAPTGLTATGGNAQVALSWTASSGATSYNVLRSTVSGSGYASVATGITVTNYTNTGLTNGTTYYFVVTATNASGTSGNSAQASATPQPAIPAAPTGLTATPGSAQVGLSWTVSSGATSYNVLRSTVSGSGYASIATGITVTNYTNTGLTNGTTYYFVVTATNTSGTSGNSAQASATPVATGAANIAAGTPTIDGVVDTVWSSATAYAITKVSGTISSSTDCSGTWKGLWDTSNLYILADITDDVKVNDSVNPWDDDSVEIYLDADHNGGTAYDANDRQVVCGWNDTAPVEGAGRAITGVTFAKADPTTTSYRIEAKIPWSVESFTPSAGSVIGIDVHINDDDDGGARDGKLMWNDGTDMAWTNPSLFGAGTLLSGGVTIPAAPTGLSAIPGNAQVALSWTASSGATSYNVLRSTVSGSGYASVVTGLTATTYTNTGLTNGTTYYFVVSATNSAGTSANSAQASATPTTGAAIVAINCGGPAASPFIADAYYNAGTTAINNTGTVNSTGVTNPAPLAVYQSERYGTVTYTIPGLVANSARTVRLHFTEDYWTAAGQRTFNVSINGTQVLSNFDIYATTGAQHKVTIQQFSTTANASGQIVIVFTTVVNNAKIDGIEVY